MTPIPPLIATQLTQLNVLSLAVCHDDMPWSASAFFAYDAAGQRLLLLSSAQTRHGQLLALNPRVAGTIADQFSEIAQIHGLQFYGLAGVLEQPAQREPALQLYLQRFPQARGFDAPVWEIRLLQLKFTDNRQGFGTKFQWHRHDGATSPAVREAAACTTTPMSIRGNAR